MKPRLFFIVISAFLLGLASCKRPTSLHYLDGYAGKDPAASGVWDSEPLHSQMKDLLGDQYDQFMKYMKNAAPLIKDKYIYSYSRIDQDSTKGYAVLLVDTKTSKLLGAIVTNYQIQKFQSPAEAFTIPADLQSKLDSAGK